jgi:hypothetical protein
MPQCPSTADRSLARLGAVLALAVVMLFLVVPHRAAAFVCENNYSYTETYYSSPTHQTMVGKCFFPCNGSPTCTGTTSPYYTQIQVACCSG